MSKFACKIPFDVDPETSRYLDSQSKICNNLYNRLLEQANGLVRQYAASGGQDSQAAKTVYSKRGLRDLVPLLKVEYPYYRAVYSSPLKNAALRLSRAINAYQQYKKGKRTDEVGWPGFRKWKKKWFSLEYDEPWKGYGLDGRTLTLSFGIDKDGHRLRAKGQLAEALPYPAHQIKALRIVKEIGQFYAVFTIDRQAKPPPETFQRLAYIDPNHKNLGYLLDRPGKAIEIENMPDLKILDRRIDEVKSKRDRCQRRSKRVEFERSDGSIHRHWQPSRRWRRYNQVLDRLYRLRREQTKTFLFTIANALFEAYDGVGIGDYTPRGGGLNRGMRRSMNNQSLIGRFKKVLTRVAEREGKLFIELSEEGTTRTCHDCDYVVPGGISPDVRQWDCPHCGSHHIRDENSARNGFSRLMKKMNLVSGSDYPVVAKPRERYTWRVMPGEAVRERPFTDGSSQAHCSSVQCATHGGSGARSCGQCQDELNQTQPEKITTLTAPDLSPGTFVQI
jgi:putative transposase